MSQGNDAAAGAFAELAATLTEIEARWVGPERGMHTPAERAAGRYLVAQRDPGVPNWLDAAGLETGMIFWRFLLPQENVGAIETELVPVESLRP